MCKTTSAIGCRIANYSAGHAKVRLYQRTGRALFGAVTTWLKLVPKQESQLRGSCAQECSVYIHANENQEMPTWGFADFPYIHIYVFAFILKFFDSSILLPSQDCFPCVILVLRALRAVWGCGAVPEASHQRPRWERSRYWVLGEVIPEVQAASRWLMRRQVFL